MPQRPWPASAMKQAVFRSTRYSRFDAGRDGFAFADRECSPLRGALRASGIAGRFRRTGGLCGYPPSPPIKKPAKAGFFIGGEGGIRTRDRLSPIHTFQACSLNHSDTSPGCESFREAAQVKPLAVSATRRRILQAALLRCFQRSRRAASPRDSAHIWVICSTAKPLAIRRSACVTA